MPTAEDVLAPPQAEEPALERRVRRDDRIVRRILCRSRAHDERPLIGVASQLALADSALLTNHVSARS